MARRKQRSVADLDSFVLERIGPVIQIALVGLVAWGVSQIGGINESLVGIHKEMARSKAIYESHDDAIKELKAKQRFFSEHFMTREEVARHFEVLEKKIDELRRK